MHASSMRLSTGTPFPFGCTAQDKGFNFSIAVKDATQLTLYLFTEERVQFAKIALDPLQNKTGDIWHIKIDGLLPFTLYAYQIVSPLSPYPDTLIVDPYAKALSSPSLWKDPSDTAYVPLGKCLPPSSFDWQNTRPPRLRKEDLIIYELHVRGFTQSTSSDVSAPGSFAGVIEKIPYLKNLGINAIELMPVFEFNEQEVKLINPLTGQKLVNYFGYSPVNFFCLMNRFASQSDKDQTVNEFKSLVRALHENEMELILDVVFNHTAEGNEKGSVHSFKALNKQEYYLMGKEGEFLNFSGCGNSFNANSPWGYELVLSALRYFVQEMQVDGFRFDLASILSRNPQGTPIGQAAAIIEAISKDPLLAETKLIAEAWDAAGLYQVGHFYNTSRWSEWNGHYRDAVRRFIKGNSGSKTAFATAICGSQDLYGWRKKPSCSINFITSHDGFTLKDLVSYNDKHNEENGENNQDGFNCNDSWNCGCEGPTHSKKIIALRERQMRNFHLALMISQGIPMVLMGDEYGHSKMGNNNSWCQDNALNWFLWDELKINAGFHRFFSSLIHFRNNHSILRQETFLTDQDISWHGTHPFQPCWEQHVPFIAFTLHAHSMPVLYVAFNASHTAQHVTFPFQKERVQEKGEWKWVVNTANSSPHDFYEEGERPFLELPHFHMPPYSAIVLERAEVKKIDIM